MTEDDWLSSKLEALRKLETTMMGAPVIVHFGEGMTEAKEKESEIERWAAAEAERCCDSKHEHELAITWAIAGVEWFRERVVRELMLVETANARAFLDAAEIVKGIK